MGAAAAAAISPLPPSHTPSLAHSPYPTPAPPPKALKSHVDQQLSDNLHHAAAAVSGQTWVRGWDDAMKQAPGAAGAAAAGEGK